MRLSAVCCITPIIMLFSFAVADKSLCFHSNPWKIVSHYGSAGSTVDDSCSGSCRVRSCRSVPLGCPAEGSVQSLRLSLHCSAGIHIAALLTWGKSVGSNWCWETLESVLRFSECWFWVSYSYPYAYTIFPRTCTQISVEIPTAQNSFSPSCC